ncbi:MAG TPA: WecB/TagA/CpsF family glycosyltransferase [Myxococcota bacterium]|nr:WecB/TagA/CpsF family glycosyltransferase [Myxococcota bacterium]
MSSRALPISPGGERAPAESLHRVELFGSQLLCGSYEQVADWLIAQARGGTAAVAAHVNLNNCYELRRWPGGIEKSAQLELIFDGIGLKLAAWALGQGWVRDLNGTDLFPIVMQRAAAHGLRVFFLGGRAEIVERAAERARRDFPGLVVAGVHHGYFVLDACDSVVHRVRRARPDLLVVGMGFPRQEEFALAQRRRLGARLIWTAGGLFDFVSGAKPRAPRWLRRLRLEWLYRLWLEPARMWRRNTVPPLWLAWNVLRWRLRALRRPA